MRIAHVLPQKLTSQKTCLLYVSHKDVAGRISGADALLNFEELAIAMYEAGVLASNFIFGGGGDSFRSARLF